MKIQQSVLFDAPGPKAQRRILATNVLGIILFLGAAAFVLKGLNDQGQLESELWTPFLTADVWQFTILPGLMNTFKAAAAAIVTSVVFGLQQAALVAIWVLVGGRDSLIGAFVVASLNNGLVMVGAQATTSDIYLGGAIIGAMILNVQVDRLRTRRRK